MPVIGDNLCDLHEKLKTIDDSSVSIHLFTGGHDRRYWEREPAAPGPS